MLTPERTAEIRRAADAYVRQLIASRQLVKERGKWYRSAPFFAPAAKVGTPEEYQAYDTAYRAALERR
jgi:hypothetical protein